MLLKNQSFSNVVTDGVASCRIQPGMVINGLQIVMGGTSADPTTDITRVVVRINEKIVVDLSAAEIEQIQLRKGISATATQLYLDFNEMAGLNVGSMVTGAHDTSKGVTAYDLEVTTASAPADLTLESYRDVSPAHPNSPGIDKIRAYIPQTLSFTGSGKYSHLPSVGPNRPSQVLRLHFLGSVVTAIGVKKGGMHVFENVPTAANEANLLYWGRVAVANHYMVDFCKRGILEEALYTGDGRQLEYEVETSGAGDVKLITEQIISLGAL